MNNIDDTSYQTLNEKDINLKMVNFLMNSPIPNEQLMANIGLFLNSKNLSRLLFLDYIYKKILDVQGVIFEMGTRWGQNFSCFNALRGIYEPFNRHRKIVAFDTFDGFPEITQEDGNSEMMKTNNISVTKNYEEYLEQIIKLQEAFNPIGHIKKYDIIKGDAIKKVEEYLTKYPETIISLIYFDFDLYKPTKICLELLKDRFVKGTVVAFDELNDHDSPGETIAIKEVFGLNNIKLKKFKYASRVSYFIV